jgi:hypothetical protein
VHAHPTQATVASLLIQAPRHRLGGLHRHLHRLLMAETERLHILAHIMPQLRHHLAHLLHTTPRPLLELMLLPLVLLASILPPGRMLHIIRLPMLPHLADIQRRRVHLRQRPPEGILMMIRGMSKRIGCTLEVVEFGCYLCCILHSMAFHFISH